MPAAIELLADLVLVAAWLVAWGLLMAYRTSLKRLLLGIASLFNHSIGFRGVGGRPLGFIADAITAVADAIDTALASIALACEKGAIVLLHGVTQQAKWLGQVLAELAETMEGKFRWWMALFPPAALVWAAVRAGKSVVHTAQTIIKPTVHTVRVVTTRVQVLDKHAKSELHSLEGQVSALTERVVAIEHSGTTAVTHAATAAEGAIEHPIATTFPRIGNVTEDLGAIRSKVRNLARYLTPAGIVALIGATIFKEFRLGWLRCPSVGKIGRGICGAEGILSTVFADAIMAFAIADLCRFANGLERVAEEIRPLMYGWVDVANALYNCNDVDATPALRLRGLSPTPLVDAIALR